MDTNEKVITVNEMPVKVVRKNIKNVHLAVYPPDGNVRISVPRAFNDDAVRLAVVEKLSWIKRHIKAIKAQPRQGKREFVTGESHYFLGQRYLLEVVNTTRSPSVELKNKKTLVLKVKEGSSVEKKERVLTEWYRKEMKNLLPSVIQKWESKTGLKVAAFGIKRMKTRWGTCNARYKRIWLNLELIKKPMNCIEYVVVHEMVHFLERLHNDNFKAHMDRFMPQWRTYKDELNQTYLAYEDWGAD